MIKISRISSPLKDKVKNLETCSQLDGDGVFEGKYKTSGSILIRNKFIGELSADQIIVDEKGVVEGIVKSSELIVSGNVSGKIIKFVTDAMWSNFLAQIPHKIPNNDNNKDEKNPKINIIKKL